MTAIRASALAELLKRYRVAAGLTQDELAERAQLSVRAISDLERGMSRMPHKVTLRLLAEALGLSDEERDDLLLTLRAFRATERDTTPSSAQPSSQEHDIPTSLTPLIGREREEAAIAHLFRHDDVRLLTLTGPAGIGKTRLAAQAAIGLRDRFATVAFVSLAAITDYSLVLPAIAQGLGLRQQTDQSPNQQLREYLAEHEALLLLDNVEQVARAGPDIVRLLADCPGVRALITSRVALRVRGEQELSVPPLSTPEIAHLPTLEQLTQYAAVALFIQRARAVKPTFEVTSALAPTIAAICARLDGLPLAIELAAARIKLLSPQTLLARLGASMAVLTHGFADLPERQQTMRRAIEWSYDLLTPDEQMLFRRLTVFVGGWTLEAAAAVCYQRDVPANKVLDEVAALVDHSLVVQGDGADGEPRFRLLELIREYGWEQLGAQHEERAVRSRHAHYYCELAEMAVPEMHSRGQVVWLARLEEEHPNLRAALGWARTSRNVKCGLRLGSAIWWFWQLHGHAYEGQRWLEHFLSLQPTVESVGDKARRANALKGAGNLAWSMGEYEKALPLLEESLDLYRALEQTQGVAHILNTQGLIADARGEYARAEALFEESLALWRELHDSPRIGAVLNNLATVAYNQAQYATAVTLNEEGLALHREADDQWSIALTLNNLGEAARAQGNLSHAARLLEQSLALYREVGDKGEAAYTLRNLGDVAREQGDLERAGQLTHESLLVGCEVGDKFVVVGALDSAAEIAYAMRRSAVAAQLFALATVLREKHQLPRSSASDAQYMARIDDVSTTLGAKAFAKEWARGQSSSLREAMVLAIGSETEQAQNLETALAEVERRG